MFIRLVSLSLFLKIPMLKVLCEHNISQSTFYKWRSKYGGMDASLITRLKELEAEKARLKCTPKKGLNQTSYRTPCQKSGSARKAQRVSHALR